ncbi:hypothetical protein ALC53_03719 [Atta colombica]|uniref:Uncharacterized protein n=1 Tax=Atta colombica TaxID=520822 RepID=A0A195BP18_9HYME|nr:hypothetical protein ALC53_03719 [Atta colombica]
MYGMPASNTASHKVRFHFVARNAFFPSRSKNAQPETSGRTGITCTADCTGLYNLKLGLITLHLLLYIPCITRHVDTEDHLHIYHMIFLSFSKTDLRLQHNSIVCNARPYDTNACIKVSNWKGVPSHRALYTMRSYAWGVRFDHILVRNMRAFIPVNRSLHAACVFKALTRDRLACRLFRNNCDRNGPLTICALKEKRPPESSNPANLIVH